MDNTLGKHSGKEKVQKFGRFLSGMVMPNLGAFIAWGIFTALFIPTGWIPNEKLATAVGPMIIYLLPLLIAYTGGKLVDDVRGGVIGAVAAMGVIVGSDIPMFLGAMIMGPLGGWVIKKFDGLVEGKVGAGFEMLVANFSAGIFGGGLAILGFYGIGPVVASLNGFLSDGVQGIINANLLPFVSLFIEPGKILFLNNAMNHGILSPLGIAQSAATGKSIFFLLETNPGPGLGILLAYWFFSRGMVKESAPSAIIIHFLGGIHEIYFPYVLMNPILVLAVIAGGMSGVFTFVLLGAGLIAVPSPGSILALMAMTPRGGLLPVLTGVTVSTAVSFVVASFFLKRKSAKASDEELVKAQSAVKEMKAESKGQTKVHHKEVHKIVVACDAGMGSSAMGATTLRKKLQKAGLDIEVIHSSIENIPEDTDIVITHKSLSERAGNQCKNAELITIEQFVGAPIYDELVERLKK